MRRKTQIMANSNYPNYSNININDDDDKSPSSKSRRRRRLTILTVAMLSVLMIVYYANDSSGSLHLSDFKSSNTNSNLSQVEVVSDKFKNPWLANTDMSFTRFFRFIVFDKDKTNLPSDRQVGHAIFQCKIELFDATHNRLAIRNWTPSCPCTRSPTTRSRRSATAAKSRACIIRRRPKASACCG